MNNQVSPFNKAETIKILLAEYAAIEAMHAHYDLLNMSMTAIVTAGVFTVWGIVIQSAFQPHFPVDNKTFVNSVAVLAFLLFIVLSVWIRYTTIHRCIVIKKLNRSHEIEAILRMKQNQVFRYKPEQLTAPLTSEEAKRRPGGHTLELLLYLSLSTFGGIIALLFEWHVKSEWAFKNYVLIIILLLAPLLAILWMTFCKMDATLHIRGKVSVGLPWNFLFAVATPINSFLRRLANARKSEL